MKKIWLMVAISSSILLTSCTQKNDKAINEEGTVISSTKEEGIDDKMDQQKTYVGILTEDAEVSGETVRLTLNDVETEDGKDTLNEIGKDGVILNAEKTTIKGTDDVSNWTTGTKIKFTVQEPVVMSRSLPPQIPGSVIKEIEKVD